MSNGFDDFLQDLRGELERCVANEETASARHTPERVPVWRSRTVIVWATALLVVAAVAVGAVETQSSNGPPSGNNLVPGNGASGVAAIVLPLTPQPIASPSVAAAPAGYSLSAVAAHTAADVWAVGDRIETSDGAQPGASLHSLVMRWEGAVWREVLTPDIGPLTAVGVAAGSQVWALSGSTSDVLHYNGATWSVVPTNAPDGSRLNGLAAVGPNDVWIVGSRPGGALIERWNGLAWQTIEAPGTAGGNASLAAVSGSSATNVWAVGSDGEGALVYTWDGTRWSQTPAPDADRTGEIGSTALWAVAAISPTQVWGADDQLWRWDGTRWQQSGGAYAGDSGQMSAVSANDIWLAAATAGAAHFDGTVWRSIGAGETGVPAGATVVVRSVDAASPTDVWVAGSIQQTSDGRSLPLVLHWNGSAWRVAVDSVRTP
jgi:hypothetical protein